jgi:hypothetical protein
MQVKPGPGEELCYFCDGYGSITRLPSGRIERGMWSGHIPPQQCPVCDGWGRVPEGTAAKYRKEP